MIEKVKSALWFAILVIFVFFIMRGLDWIVPRPPAKVFVCVEDFNGKHGCTEYKQEKP
jgi:hypothetical protein